MDRASPKTSILVTGANGFIGRHLVEFLASKGRQVISGQRNATGATSTSVTMGDLSQGISDALDLSPFECIVHLAGLPGGKHASDDFDQVNCHAALALTKVAAEAGVKRFIFLSSAKVNGETTEQRAFSIDDTPQPSSLYSQSKYKAEQALLDYCQHTAMELVIIRPPVVYGNGVGGNLGLLAKLVDYHLPIPLGSVSNQRSMVGLENLVDFIDTCIDHPTAANQTFFVSDSTDLSTPALIRAIAKARNKKPLMLPIPPRLLVLLTKTVGLTKISDSLVASFQVDGQTTCEQLNWSPPHTTEHLLQQAFSNKG